MLMDTLILLQTYPFVAYVIVGLVALLVGSFLNVVIYRLPVLLYRDWQQQCQVLLKQPFACEPETLNLAWPLSHCPQCKKLIRPWHNIPIISYFTLKGCCYHCGYKISWRYPLVEFLSTVMALMVFYHYGFSWQTLAGLVFTWGLLALLFIDLEHQLLPDHITLSLLWLGLIVNLFALFTTSTQAILGAVIGYTSLWLMGWIFQKVRRIEGIGHGDFKLLAMLGAWVGWQVLPSIVLVASFAGAMTGLALLFTGKIQRKTPIPFGPYLAIAGWLGLLYAPHLQHYLYFSPHA
jgi:leader peptidase (prepilin peptidase) / N-methyltransferase